MEIVNYLHSDLEVNVLRSIFINILYKVRGLFLVVGDSRVVICLHQRRILAYKSSSYIHEKSGIKWFLLGLN